MVEPRDVVVTVREAEGIMCPYTGKPVEIHMIVRPGSITYYAPDAFTLAEPVADLDTLIRLSTTRGGISGVVSMAEGRRDVRTGKEMDLRKLPDGRVCFVGGFNPRAACGSLEMLIYMLTMKNGVATRPRPEAAPQINKPTSTFCPTHKTIEPGEETLEHAKDIIEKSGKFAKKSTIVNPGVPKKGGKR